MNFSGNMNGKVKWKLPSGPQAIILVIVFGLPIGLGVLFYDRMPGFFRIPFFITWFVLASVFYIYTITHGKGKEQTTIIDVNGLEGEFTINNNLLAFSSIYIFAASAGAFLNRSYFIGALLFAAGIAVIYAAKYYRKKLRFDVNGQFYILQNGNEYYVDFTRLKYAECRQNEMTSENVYQPRINLQFMDLSGENLNIKLKINALRSLKYGTYSDPRLIIYFIKEKCIQQKMNITFTNNSETDFTADRI